MTQTEFHHATPVYEEMPAGSRTSGTAAPSPSCRKRPGYVRRLEELSGARVSVIGVGPGRDENVVINDLIG